MSTTAAADAAPATPLHDLAFAVGVQAAIYGLPLVESMRTAALMTCDGPAAAGRAPLNQFAHASRPWTHEDRDVVTPANDLLYSMAWLDLSAGPVLLDLPAERQRYWVMALLDAYTNNFANIGARQTGGQAMRVAIAAPGWAGELPDDVRLVQAPTPLVWVLGRVLVADDADLPAARALQQRFGLTAPAAAPAGRYTGFVGDTALANVDDALGFFDNLMRGLAQNPPPAGDAALVASFGAAGLRPGMPVNAQVLDGDTRSGLQRGFAAAQRIVESRTQSRRAGAWGINLALGRFGHDHLARAATAAKGLGGLAADEAVYAMSDFDADRQPLTGERRYRLRFEAGQLPPCDAFWSVSLYGPDRFFVANAIGRHAIGDRTPGLRHEPDGALELCIAHAPPASGVSNWLPAPAGPFYLILRLYHPRADVLTRSWRIPPLQVLA